MTQLSIIIPVYNKEKCIEQCIRSCVDQDMESESYEIIIVNDGSTDKSSEIIHKLKDLRSNIKFLEQPNQGVGAARNNGLKNSKGEFIWFVDSDDRIEVNCLKHILSLVQKEQLDALQIGYQMINDDDRVPIGFGKNTNVCTPGEYIMPEIFAGGGALTIFKREIAISNGIEFDTDMMLAEDQLFVSEVLDHCKRIMRTSRIFYFYIRNADSLTQNSTIESLEKSIQKIRQFKLYNRYYKYFNYLLSIQFFEYLKAGGNPIRLSKIIPPLFLKEAYKWHEGHFRQLMFYYQYIGLVALIVFLCFKKLKHLVTM